MINKEILIIGAGPAGTSAAIKLAEEGFLSLLVDQDDFPRDKVCGDAVSGEGLDILADFGLSSETERAGFKTRKREFYSQGLEPQIMDKETINIPRKKFDFILLKKALSMGVGFMRAQFKGEVQYQDGYHLVKLWDFTKEEEVVVKAKYLILATGCQKDALLKPLFKENRNTPSDQVAYRGYYCAQWPIKERKYFFLPELNPGYAWIFPLGDDVFNVGCGGKILKSRKLELKDSLSRFINTINSDYNLKGEWLKEPRGGTIRSNFTNLINFKKYPNLVLIGEAMGATYPFSGGGIGKAMFSGILAADAIIEVLKNSLKESLSKKYIEEIDQKMKPKYYTALKWCDLLLTKSFLQKFILKKVFQNRRYPNLIPDIICGNLKAEKICSLPFVFELILPFSD